MPFTDSPSKIVRDDPRAKAIDRAARDDSFDTRVRQQPAIKFTCPTCDALADERCYASRKPKRFAREFHPERLALVPPQPEPETTTAQPDAGELPPAVKPSARKTGDPRTDRALADARDAKRAAKTPKPADKPDTDKPAPPKPLSTNARKRVVAEALIRAAADLAETWDHAEISAEDATAYISQWLNYLPRSAWDARLNERSGAGKRSSATA